MNKLLLPPLSEKYCEGHATKNEWLLRYFEHRMAIAEGADSRRKLTEFQSAMGKNSSILADRFRGCLLGLAIGDALGTTLEFQPRKANEDHREMMGGGVFGLKKGEWTDDTSMALCLAYSLLEKKTFDADHQMRMYLSWYKEGVFSSNGKCFDIGNTTAQALNRYEKTGEPFSGSDDERSAGNGSVMRLAPVVLFYASMPSDAIENAGLSSETTHANVVTVDSCRYFAGLLVGALLGSSKEELFSGLFEPIKGYWDFHPVCDLVKNVSKGNYKERSRESVKSSGYVIDSLEAALWAFNNSQTFEEGMVKAVNLGGDADTIGAIYGQIAGAYYGETSIPFRWIRHLKYVHYFYYLADELVGYYSGKPVQ